MQSQTPKIPFEEFLARYQEFKMRQWPRLVGREGLAVYQENFDNGGYTDKVFIRWKPRKGDTANKGRRLGDGGKQSGRAILIKTGALRRSLRIGYALPAQVRWAAGSQDVPYAQIHNEGGTIKGSVSVGTHSRQTKKAGSVQVKGHTRSVNTRIPRRQFMGSSQKLMDRLDRKWFDRLNQMWRAS
jgi:phage gpG-like protein